MSISTKNTDPADREFADVVFAPKSEEEQKPAVTPAEAPTQEETPAKAPAAPAKEETPSTAAPAPEEKPSTPEAKEETSAPKEEVKEEKAPEPVKEAKEEPKKEEKKAEEATAPKKESKSSWMDATLLGVLVALIGGGGYFIYDQMEKYDVPSPYEEAKAEYVRLKAELETLRGGENNRNARVNKSVSLINAIKNTDSAIKEARVALQREKEALSALDASIARTKEGIDAALYNLRTTDKDCRAKALSELPGLPIGDAVHKRKADSMQNAIIHRVDTGKKTITFRAPTGQVTWAMKDVVTKDFPTIARYALELEDLVDMTILNTVDNAGEKAPKRPVAQRTPKRPVATEEADYDPTPGAPVINSKPGESITTDGPVVDPTEPASTPTWDAPTGDLPL